MIWLPSRGFGFEVLFELICGEAGARVTEYLFERGVHVGSVQYPLQYLSMWFGAKAEPGRLACILGLREKLCGAAFRLMPPGGLHGSHARRGDGTATGVTVARAGCLGLPDFPRSR
jgi:hypothetical protein